MRDINVNNPEPDSKNTQIGEFDEGECLVPLCKNCEFFKFDEFSGFGCIHPKAFYKWSLILGSKLYYTARYMRLYGKACGTRGKLFKPRKTLLQKLISLFRKSGGENE